MSLAPRSEFIDGEGVAYLNTAGHGLAPKSAIEACARYFERRSEMTKYGGAVSAVYDECRSRLADLMSVDAGDIALLSSSSEGDNAIYSLIDWLPGDNIVLTTNDLEFPSVVQPAIKRAVDFGVEVRVVDHNNWIITPDMVASAVDENTQLVFLSHVSYRTGYRFDLEATGNAIRSKSNAIFAVDAAQSLGVVPVAVSACDFVVSTGSKWLLGPHGVAPFYWNRERRPDVVPTNIGWFSVVDDLEFPWQLKPDAARFELGGPAYLAIAALNEGLKVIQGVGVARIEAHALNLGSVLLDQLRDFNLPIMAPDDPALRAGIVSWEDPDCRATARKLQEQGIVVTGSSGRIRVSMHLYNDQEDVDRFVRAFAGIQ